MGCGRWWRACVLAGVLAGCGSGTDAPEAPPDVPAAPGERPPAEVPPTGVPDERSASLDRVEFQGFVRRADTDRAGNTYLVLQYGPGATFRETKLPDDGRRKQHALVKLDAALGLVWARALPMHEPPHGDDGPLLTFELAVPPSGAFIVIAGAYNGRVIGRTGSWPVGKNPRNPRAYVARLSGTGELEWVKTFGGNPGAVGFRDVDVSEDVIGLAGGLVGPSEELGTRGHSVDNNTGLMVRMRASDGTFTTHTFSGGFAGNAESVAVGPEGEVVVGGYTMATLQTLVEHEPYFARMDASGALAWERRSVAYEGDPLQLEVAGDGTVVIASTVATTGDIRWGDSTLRSAGPRVVLLTLERDGRERWARELVGDVQDFGLATGVRGDIMVAARALGRVTLGGPTVGEDGKASVVVMRMRLDGTHLWSTSISPGTAVADERDEYGVAVLEDGRARVAAGQDLVLVTPAR